MYASKTITTLALALPMLFSCQPPREALPPDAPTADTSQEEVGVRKPDTTVVIRLFDESIFEREEEPEALERTDRVALLGPVVSSVKRFARTHEMDQATLSINIEKGDSVPGFLRPAEIARALSRELEVELPDLRVESGSTENLRTPGHRVVQWRRQDLRLHLHPLSTATGSALAWKLEAGPDGRALDGGLMSPKPGAQTADQSRTSALHPLLRRQSVLAVSALPLDLLLTDMNGDRQPEVVVLYDDSLVVYSTKASALRTRSRYTFRKNQKNTAKLRRHVGHLLAYRRSGSRLPSLLALSTNLRFPLEFADPNFEQPRRRDAAEALAGAAPEWLIFSKFDAVGIEWALNSGAAPDTLTSIDAVLSDSGSEVGLISRNNRLVWLSAGGKKTYPVDGRLGDQVGLMGKFLVASQLGGGQDRLMVFRRRGPSWPTIWTGPQSMGPIMFLSAWALDGAHFVGHFEQTGATSGLLHFSQFLP